jgi:hypothetical protein
MKFTLEPLNDRGYLAFQINTSLMRFEVLMAISMMAALFRAHHRVECHVIAENLFPFLEVANERLP